MNASEGDRYADTIVEALADDFPDLRNPAVAAMVRRHVSVNAQTGRGVEVIIDNPSTARWRLIQAPDDPYRVHLGCWKVEMPVRDVECLNRLNTVLREITV